MNDIYAAPSAEVGNQPATDDLFATAIGPKNTDYYLRYLQKSEGSPWQASWNWPAFLVTSLWLLYRKVWLGWLIYVVLLPIGLTVLTAVVGAGLGETAGTLIYFVGFAALMLAFPVWGNALYKRKLTALVDKAQRLHAEREAQRAYLARHGGTSWVVVTVLIIIPLLLGIVAAVAIPAYNEYLEAARQAAERSG